MQEVRIREFNKGLITRIESESLPYGAAEDVLNWHFLGDHVELRRGQQVYGTENTGGGRITGLKKATRFDGTEVLFKTYDRKLKYYDEATEDWIENGTDLLDSAADEKDIALEEYHSMAGAFLYAGSPYSDFYKVPIANPGSAVAQSITNHRGLFRLKRNRCYLWNRQDTNGGFDTTGLYLSHIDKDELSDYTFVDDEALGSGDGSTKTFAGTLSAVTGARTCMYVIITDGTETFIDDRNGTLVGDQGGTGTINYATGAYSVTFNTAPTTGTDNVTGDYYHENSTTDGILDFTYTPTRVAGEGAVFRQDDAGAAMQNIGTLDDDEYCFHTLKTYKLTLSSDDTNATNFIYRARVGIPYWRATFETGDGLYYVDTISESEPHIRRLRKSNFYDDTVPESLSEGLDLSHYVFDESVLYKYGDLLLVACKKNSDSTANDRLLVYNERWQTWEVHNIRASVIDEYDNGLFVGDSATNNVLRVLHSFADEDATIINHITFGEYDLNYAGQKKVNLLRLRGLIGRDQKLKVSIALDGGDFVEVGFTESGGVHTYAIEDTGDYVSYAPAALVGTDGIGTTEIGGGGSGADAYLYEREFRINTDRFEKIRIKVEAVEVGYASITELALRDIRAKDVKALPVYTGNA